MTLTVVPPFKSALPTLKLIELALVGLPFWSSTQCLARMIQVEEINEAEQLKEPLTNSRAANGALAKSAVLPSMIRGEALAVLVGGADSCVVAAVAVDIPVRDSMATVPITAARGANFIVGLSRNWSIAVLWPHGVPGRKHESKGTAETTKPAETGKCLRVALKAARKTR